MIEIHEGERGVVSSHLLRRLRDVAPATFGHLISEGFADGALRPLTGVEALRVVGRAFTIRCRGADGAAVHLGIDRAAENDVLVIDRGGDVSRACWGEMTTRAAMERGLAGTIIDGAATDVSEITELNYPVWARGITALTTVSKGEAGELGSRVMCGGVEVGAGDLVLADENGILFMSPRVLVEMLETAEAREAREIRVRKEISSGRSLAEISGASKAEVRVIRAE